MNLPREETIVESTREASVNYNATTKMAQLFDGAGQIDPAATVLVASDVSPITSPGPGTEGSLRAECHRAQSRVATVLANVPGLVAFRAKVGNASVANGNPTDNVCKH